MRKLIRVTSLVVAIIGAVLLVGSIPSPIGWIDWPTTFVAPGAGLLGVGFTAFIAQMGLETVVDKRLTALDASTRQNRSRVYEEIFRHVIQSFGGTPTLTDHEVRARAATWASGQTLDVLADWIRYESRNSGILTRNENVLAERYELVYRIARSMRQDLQLDSFAISKSALLSAIFEDFSSTKYSKYEVADITVSESGEIVRAPV